MYPDSIRALQADTLSVPALQHSDQLSISQIWQAAAAALDAHGGKDCAGPVAQEFGDHPETAAVRMRWARATAAVLDGQPAPRMRRIAAAGSPALGLTRTPRARSAAGHG
jgi:hypothetical protein